MASNSQITSLAVAVEIGFLSPNSSTSVTEMTPAGHAGVDGHPLGQRMESSDWPTCPSPTGLWMRFHMGEPKQVYHSIREEFLHGIRRPGGEGREEEARPTEAFLLLHLKMPKFQSLSTSPSLISAAFHM